MKKVMLVAGATFLFGVALFVFRIALSGSLFTKADKEPTASPSPSMARSDQSEPSRKDVR